MVAEDEGKEKNVLPISSFTPAVNMGLASCEPLSLLRPLMAFGVAFCHPLSTFSHSVAFYTPPLPPAPLDGRSQYFSVLTTTP